MYVYRQRESTHFWGERGHLTHHIRFFAMVSDVDRALNSEGSRPLMAAISVLASSLLKQASCSCLVVGLFFSRPNQNIENKTINISLKSINGLVTCHFGFCKDWGFGRFLRTTHWADRTRPTCGGHILRPRRRFHKWWYPNSWMVNFMENPSKKMDDGGTSISGNHQMWLFVTLIEYP